ASMACAMGMMVSTGVSLMNSMNGSPAFVCARRLPTRWSEPAGHRPGSLPSLELAVQERYSTSAASVLSRIRFRRDARD
ncbi:MAG: hypothetical protein OXN22_04660, partial [Deltaproteobacteria bacterium]|nr:hypothetical protein [Deltaproteobacteria bacterium]